MMNVAALQQFLRSLTGPMQAAGASQKVVNELQEAERALEPFRELDFAQFAAFLRQADEYRRTGVLPIPAKSSRALRISDPTKIHELAQQAAQLKEGAAGADGPADALNAEFDRLDLKALSKKDVLAVAREVGARATVRMSQDEAIDAVRRWVLGRQDAAPPTRPAETAEIQQASDPSDMAASDPA